MIKLSVILIAYNEEENIGRCLKSILGVADEIVVVDSSSTDRTIAVCESFGARIIQRDFSGFGPQKQFAVAQASYNHILFLDADEELSETLKSSILEVKKDFSQDGYSFNRRNYYCNRFIRHCGWNPDKLVRLFDRRKLNWNDKVVHERIETTSGTRLQHLKGYLNHYTCRTIEEHQEKEQRYARLNAEMLANKRKWISPLTPSFKKSARFIKTYLLHLGFLDGHYGLVISRTVANSSYLKYAIARKTLRNRKGEKPESIGVIISTYNNPAWLEKVFWGYECQTYKNFEIIVADDGSAQPTADLIARFQQNSLLKIKHVWQADEGFQKSRILNKAILAAESEYLLFTDQDCVPRADFLETHYQYAKKGHFLSGGYSRLPMDLSLALTMEDVETARAFDLKWMLSQGLEHSFKNTKLWKCSLWSKFMNSITPAAASWNGCNASGWRSDMLKINGFNEDMQYGGQDREFGERLWNYGLKSIQIRYAAICLHLDHKRPYKTDETMRKNKEIRRQTKLSHRIETPNGIRKIH
jgi:glycosyltransferase involved in cell wall biosynthesis